MMYPINGLGEAPYGNAPRTLEPWLPQVNRAGMPIVQPVANPYFAHWSENLGAVSGGGASTAFKVALIAGLGFGAWWLFTQKEPKSRLRSSSRAAGQYEVMLIPTDDRDSLKMAKFKTRSDAVAYKKRMIAGGKYRYGEIAGG